MSPIKEIKGISPDKVDWQEWKQGGGKPESEVLANLADQVRKAIGESGAAQITIEGYYALNEAGGISKSLRARFKRNGVDVATRVHEISGDQSELFIKIKP